MIRPVVRIPGPGLRTVLVGMALGLVVGLPTALPVWRPVLVGAAGGLLAVAVVRLVSLARAEWGRRRPAGRQYLTVLLLLTGALALAAVASSGP